MTGALYWRVFFIGVTVCGSLMTSCPTIAMDSGVVCIKIVPVLKAMVVR